MGIDELPEMPTSPPPPDGQPPGVPDVAAAAAGPDANSPAAPPSSAPATAGDPEQPGTEAFVDRHWDDDDDNGYHFSLASLGVPGHAAAMGGVAAEFDAATGRGAAARRSQRVLVLFSGSYRRPDGIAAFLTRRGLGVDMIDSDVVNGGGNPHDILNDAFFADLYDRVRRGDYIAVFAAPPCSTYSV